MSLVKGTYMQPSCSHLLFKGAHLITCYHYRILALPVSTMKKNKESNVWGLGRWGVTLMSPEIQATGVILSFPAPTFQKYLRMQTLWQAPRDRDREQKSIRNSQKLMRAPAGASGRGCLFQVLPSPSAGEGAAINNAGNGVVSAGKGQVCPSLSHQQTQLHVQQPLSM